MTPPRNNVDQRFGAFWREMERDEYRAIRRERFGDGDPRSGSDTLRAETLAIEYGQPDEAIRQRRRLVQNLETVKNLYGRSNR